MLANRVLIFLALIPTVANATIALDKAIVDLRGGVDRLGDVVVTNTGHDSVEVTTEASRIDNPGSKNEKRLVLNDPRELGMVVAPRVFTLAPQEQRTVRFSLISPPASTDKIYRVKFTPSSNLTTSHVLSASKVEKPKSQLSVVISYESLVIVRPPEPSLAYRHAFNNDVLHIENTGNSSFLLFDGKQCVEKKACSELPPRRVYAGESVHIPVKSKTPVRYYLEQQNQSRIVEFN